MPGDLLGTVQFMMLSYMEAQAKELQMRFKVINEDFNQILQSFEEGKNPLNKSHKRAGVCGVR